MAEQELIQQEQNTSNYTHFVPPCKTQTDLPKNNTHILIKDLDSLKEALSNESHYIAWDTETSSLSPEDGYIVGFSFSFDGKTGYYVPVNHRSFGLGKEALDIFYQALLPRKQTFVYNMRFDYRFMEYHGYDMSKVPYYDVSVGVFLADTNQRSPSLKWAERHFLGWDPETFEEALGDNYNFYFTDPETSYPYACADAEGTFAIAQATIKYFAESNYSGKLDNEVLYPLMKIEDHLNPIDTDYLNSVLVNEEIHLKNIESEIYAMTGQQFNISSSKQKGEVLQSLGIDTGQYTKTGLMKTDIGTLEHYNALTPHPLIDKIVEYAELNKSLNSYFRTMYNQALEHNKKLRFAYYTNRVPTGRLACGGDKKNPYFAELNIQSSPKPHPAMWYVHDYKEGDTVPDGDVVVMDWRFSLKDKSDYIIEGQNPEYNFRRSLLPETNDFYWVSTDFSGQELRVIANYSKCKLWSDTFLNGGDLHKSMAVSMWGAENYDKEKRKQAKCVTGDTLIYTDKGLIPIKDLSDYREIDKFTPLEINTLSLEGISKSKYFYYGGEQDTVKIETDSGISITVTPNHPLYTQDGFRRAGNLALGNSLIIAINHKDFIYKDVVSKEQAEVLGYLQQKSFITKGILIAYDGKSVIQNSLKSVYSLFSNAEYKNLDDFALLSLTLDDIDSKYGITDKEHIPQWVYRSSSQTIRSYVYGVLKASKVRVYDDRVYIFKYEQFVKDLQQLLLYVGIPSRVYKEKDNTCLFIKQEHYTCLILNKPVSEPSVYTRIMSITRSKDEVFDLSMDSDSHSFVGNGLFNHNTLNFGMSYGMSSKTLSFRQNISEAEAEDIIDRFWKAVPEIKRFQDVCVRKAKKQGYIQNYFGRPRRVRSYFNSPDRKTQSFGVRTVNNTMIQSIGADLLRITIIKLWKRLLNNPEYKDDIIFMNTVHDEVNHSVRKSRVREIVPLILDCQQIKVPGWEIPFEVGLDIGDSFGRLFPFKYNKETNELKPDCKKVDE